MTGLSVRNVSAGIFFVAILIVVGSLKNIYSHKQSSQTESIVYSSTNASEEDNKSAAVHIPRGDDKISVQQNSSIVRDKILSVYGTAKEEALVKSWCIERAAICGLDLQNEKVYENYETTTLEAMADNGDVRAMLQLGRRYAEEFISKGNADKGLELRNQQYFKAAIYGSTGALMQLGLAANTGSLKSSKHGRELVLEPLAYYEVAAMRGDRLAKSNLGWLALKGSDVKLDDADYTYIETRAEEIYQDLLRQRKELGLGEFDNEIPEPVKRYFDRIQ